MDQALNSQKTPHTSPLRASYGMSFVSVLMKNDRVIKGFYCICFPLNIENVIRILALEVYMKTLSLYCFIKKLFHALVYNFNIKVMCKSLVLSWEWIFKGSAPLQSVEICVQGLTFDYCHGILAQTLSILPCHHSCVNHLLIINQPIHNAISG